MLGLTNPIAASSNNNHSEETNTLTEGLLSNAQEGLPESLYMTTPSTPSLSMRGISPDEYYSMSAYFQMFVMDVYTVFQQLPGPARAVVIVALLWVVWKLL